MDLNEDTTLEVNGEFVGLECQDSMTLKSKISDLRLVKYLGFHSLECSHWSVNVSRKALPELVKLGIDIVQFTDSPYTNYQ